MGWTGCPPPWPLLGRSIRRGTYCNLLQHVCSRPSLPRGATGLARSLLGQASLFQRSSGLGGRCGLLGGTALPGRSGLLSTLGLERSVDVGALHDDEPGGVRGRSSTVQRLVTDTHLGVT